jgi:hypothetical protein
MRARFRCSNTKKARLNEAGFFVGSRLEANKQRRMTG